MTDSEPKAPQELQEGDKASWNWGGGQPSGKVEAVVPDTHSIESKRGNEISKHGTEDDPAVELRQGSVRAPRRRWEHPDRRAEPCAEES